MSTFLRRYKQSILHKYNCTFEVLVGDNAIGEVSLGAMAWSKLFARHAARRVATQNLRVREVSAHRIKGKHKHFYSITCEVLMGHKLVGQIELVERATLKWMARKIALKTVRNGLSLRHVETVKYVAA